MAGALKGDIQRAGKIPFSDQIAGSKRTSTLHRIHKEYHAIRNGLQTGFSLPLINDERPVQGDLRVVIDVGADGGELARSATQDRADSVRLILFGKRYRSDIAHRIACPKLIGRRMRLVIIAVHPEGEGKLALVVHARDGIGLFAR